MNTNKITNFIGIMILMLMFSLIIVNTIRDYAVTVTDIIFYIVLFFLGSAFLVLENKVLESVIANGFRKIIGAIVGLVNRVINFKFGK